MEFARLPRRQRSTIGSVAPDAFFTELNGHGVIMQRERSQIYALGVTLSACLLLGLTTSASAQDAGAPALTDQDLLLDSPSDRFFEPTPGAAASDTWTNPAIDSYGHGCGCNAGCDYDCAASCGGCGVLSSIARNFHPSDRCFSEFVSPITNAIFFEDPRTLTEARFLFINHDLPDALGGGDAQVYALQLRAAINDRLSIIAIKDGFIVGQPNAPFDDGWADIGLGLKYLLWSDCCTQRLLAGGVTYELPSGTRRALQGNGDGEFNVFLSGAARIWGTYNWMVTSGARIPTNSNEESQVFYLSNHISRRLGCSNFYLVSEAHWYHWFRSGNQTALAGIEGLDLFNFGSTGVAGNSIVTGAWGVRFKPGPSTEIGMAYQVPLTSREDILDDRFTLDWIFRY